MEANCPHCHQLPLSPVATVKPLCLSVFRVPITFTWPVPLFAYREASTSHGGQHLKMCYKQLGFSCIVFEICLLKKKKKHFNSLSTRIFLITHISFVSKNININIHIGNNTSEEDSFKYSLSPPPQSTLSSFYTTIYFTFIFVSVCGYVPVNVMPTDTRRGCHIPLGLELCAVV